MFNGRLGIEATYYDARTTNALLGIALPPSEGFSSSQLRNVGEILNRGIELSVNATPVNTAGFRWSTGVNYEWTHNEILSTPNFFDQTPPSEHCSAHWWQWFW